MPKANPFPPHPSTPVPSHNGSAPLIPVMSSLTDSEGEMPRARTREVEEGFTLQKGEKSEGDLDPTLIIHSSDDEISSTGTSPCILVHLYMSGDRERRINAPDRGIPALD